LKLALINLLDSRLHGVNEAEGKVRKGLGCQTGDKMFQNEVYMRTKQGGRGGGTLRIWVRRGGGVGGLAQKSCLQRGGNQGCCNYDIFFMTFQQMLYNTFKNIYRTDVTIFYLDVCFMNI
jgi:hypothetical protein